MLVKLFYLTNHPFLNTQDDDLPVYLLDAYYLVCIVLNAKNTKMNENIALLKVLIVYWSGTEIMNYNKCGKAYNEGLHTAL